jgi:serine/threonine protein kinase
MNDRSESALMTVAEAVADGSPVDWERAAKDREAMASRLANLKAIALLASTSRALAEDIDDTFATRDLGSMPADPSSASLPESWGRLRILGRLGQGSFGDVFRAFDPDLEREVALKLRRPTGAGTDHEGDRFINEARRLAKVKHPNVLVVHGVDRLDGQVGIWCEFIKGKTLEQWLREHGPLGAQEAALIGADLCRALAAVHRAGLVHRDVKSANVMREEGGRIVLMDFGCVGERIAAGGANPSGFVYGTPLYMAPEQLNGARPAPAADIYSLGVLLYHLATGAHPIEAGSFDELLYKHQHGEFVPLRDRRPELPGEFIGVTERALSPRPEDRYASVGRMERALLGRPEPVPPPWPVLRIAVGLTLVMVVAILAQWPRVRPWFASLRSESTRATPIFGSPTRVIPESQGEHAPSTSSTNAAVIPLTASASLYRGFGAARERLLPGARVRVGDQLTMEIQGSRSMYVYILNEDSEGKVFTLFPLRGVVPTNPLPGGVPLTLPGRLGNRPHTWAVSSAGGTESLIALASVEPLTALEQELTHIPEAQLGQEPTYTQISAAGVRALRGIGRLEAAPDPGGSNGSRLSEALGQLSRSVEKRSDLWVWQVQLENPKD